MQVRDVTTRLSIGVIKRRGGSGHPLAQKYFSDNYQVKFGHLKKFHTYIFGQKCLAPKVDGAPTPSCGYPSPECRNGPY